MTQRTSLLLGSIFKHAPDWLDISSTETYYSVPEIAQYFKVADSTVYRWIYKGELNGAVIGRKRKVASSEVKRFIATYNQPGTKLK